MKRYYVGCKGGRREVFTAEKKPTEQSHGSRYNAVIGPFQTKKGAEFMAQQGGSNPHIQTVADAERAVKSQKRKKLPGYSSEIKRMPEDRMAREGAQWLGGGQGGHLLQTHPA